MIEQVKHWLYRPFPFVHSHKQAFLASLIVGFFVTMFLWVFKPYGIDQIESNSLLYLSGYGFVSFLSVYITLHILPKVFRKIFDPINWNVIKNILSIVWILLLVSVFNWLYGMFLYQKIGSLYHDAPSSLLVNIGMTFSVGIFPVLIISYIFERQLFTQNSKLARSLESSFREFPVQHNGHTTFEIPMEGKGNVFISSNTLLCVKAEGGNYATVYWQDKEDTKSQLLRITLKNVLSLVERDQNILQCHKSYLVNKSFIKEVVGNARTLVIYLEGLEFEVPVSRNFPREVVEQYQLQQA